MKIRPIYHRLEHRIKSHILISFVAYIVYKEFERKLKVNNIDISVKSAIDDIKTMYGFLNKDKIVVLSLNERQQKIYDLFF